MRRPFLTLQTHTWVVGALWWITVLRPARAPCSRVPWHTILRDGVDCGSRHSSRTHRSEVDAPRGCAECRVALILHSDVSAVPPLRGRRCVRRMCGVHRGLTEHRYYSSFHCRRQVFFVSVFAFRRARGAPPADPGAGGASRRYPK
eukprot:666737-Prymnesium_polylepis.1